MIERVLSGAVQPLQPPLHQWTKRKKMRLTAVVQQFVLGRGRAGAGGASNLSGFRNWGLCSNFVEEEMRWGRGSTGKGTWGIPLYVIVQWGAVLGQAGTACILATVIWLLVMAGAGAGAWCLLNQRHNREGKHSDKTQQLDFDWGPAVAASSCPGAELSSEHPTGGCVRALCVPISYGPCQPGPGWWWPDLASLGTSLGSWWKLGASTTSSTRRG